MCAAYCDVQGVRLEDTTLCMVASCHNKRLLTVWLAFGNGDVSPLTHKPEEPVSSCNGYSRRDSVVSCDDEGGDTDQCLQWSPSRTMRKVIGIRGMDTYVGNVQQVMEGADGIEYTHPRPDGRRGRT